MVATRTDDTWKFAKKINLTNRKTIKDQIGGSDLNDFLRFTLNTRSSTSFSLTQLKSDVNLHLLSSKRQVLKASVRRGKGNRSIETVLEPGTYYLRVFPQRNSKSVTNYKLSAAVSTLTPTPIPSNVVPGPTPTPTPTSTPTPTPSNVVPEPKPTPPSTPIDYAGNSTSSARLIPVDLASSLYSDWIGEADTNDYYKFNLSKSSSLNLLLTDFSADINVRLLNSAGAVIQTSASENTAPESIARLLDAGTYYIQVYSGSQKTGTTYNLSLSAIPQTGVDTSLYWTRQQGTSNDDISKDVAVDIFGNVYIAGYTYNYRNGALERPDCWITKYDSSGVQQWTRQLGTPQEEQFGGIAVDNSGNVFITGWTAGALAGANLGAWDAFLVKYDSNGNQVWSRQFGTAGQDETHDLTVDSAGNAYIAGSSNNPWIAKYSSNGNQIWLKEDTISGSNDDDPLGGIALDSSGNLYMFGQTGGALSGWTNAGSRDVWLAKYNSQGNRLWARQLGSSGYEMPNGITVSSSGNIYLTGWTDGALAGTTSSDGRDAFVVKYDANGNQQWVKQETSGLDEGWDIIVSASEQVYIGGQGSNDGSLVSYDSNGNRIWQKTLGLAGSGAPRALTLDNSGDLYFTGETFGSLEGVNAGWFDAWVTKYQLNSSSGSTFNSTYGYGLINAATAVAKSLGQPRFLDVADLGGINWGNDLVKAPEAWARGYTGQGVTVAVIDSGVDITHSDLAANIWRNTREVAGNGIDDDGNGYTDDANGWNFGSNNNNVMNGSMSVQVNGHGTHVAGTIAGVNNGFGVTGVAYNAKIMPIKLADTYLAADGKHYFDRPGSLSAAIRYAVDNGARVINMSVGWTDSDELESAMAYAASRNVITVSSAGNAAAPSPGVPAYYATKYGISVGAVASDRTIASFSNRAGSDTSMNHVVAPGVNVYSTLPGNNYISWQGTSMAAPHVAGVVALMLSANPNLTTAQVRQILMSSSTGLNFSSQISSENGVLIDPFF